MFKPFGCNCGKKFSLRNLKKFCGTLGNLSSSLIGKILLVSLMLDYSLFNKSTVFLIPDLKPLKRWKISITLKFLG